ncbi:ammonium transporter, partial [Acaryochloris marina NIES-2412]
VGAFTLVTAAVTWAIIKAVAGLRVPEEEEIKGLDISEHGMEAYSGFLKDAQVQGSRAPSMMR